MNERPSWWKPEPGKEISFRTFGSKPQFQHHSPVSCTTGIKCPAPSRSFEHSHFCFFCNTKHAIYMGVLMTFFLEGEEAARRFAKKFNPENTQ